MVAIAGVGVEEGGAGVALVEGRGAESAGDGHEWVSIGFTGMGTRKGKSWNIYVP